MNPPKWTFRTLAAALAVVAVSARAEAQQFQPQFGPPRGPIIVHPQINTLPGFPIWPTNPNPLFNPALNNPWLNQTNIIPVNPFFAPNPFVNRFAPNPFVPNPFINNPFAPNPFAPNPFVTGVVPASFSTPPIAFRQPGFYYYRGPDLRVNPWSGTVYRPLSGVAQTGDGSVFYRVPGSGLPTATGAYAPGSGLYFNPVGGTFLNPASGVISRPGVTNVFLPWMP